MGSSAVDQIPSAPSPEPAGPSKAPTSHHALAAGSAHEMAAGTELPSPLALTAASIAATAGVDAMLQRGANCDADGLTLVDTWADGPATVVPAELPQPPNNPRLPNRTKPRRAFERIMLPSRKHEPPTGPVASNDRQTAPREARSGRDEYVSTSCRPRSVPARCSGLHTRRPLSWRHATLGESTYPSAESLRPRRGRRACPSTLARGSARCPTGDGQRRVRCSGQRLRRAADHA